MLSDFDMGQRDHHSGCVSGYGDDEHVRRERAAARLLRKSRWWQNLIQNASCHYCGIKLNSTTATMDHLIPVSRGGRSTRGNVVPACKACNTAKRDQTIFDSF